MTAKGTSNGKQGQHELLILPVDAIRPNPNSVRSIFDERALQELATSIQRWGQLQPIVVRRVDTGFELICGERRWRAHRIAGMSSIKAVEFDVADADALAAGLVENFVRVSLSHAEKIAALDQLAELTRGLGLRRVAAQLSIDPGWLSRQFAVRRDPIIFGALETGRLGFGQATELLRAPVDERRALIERIVSSERPVPTAMVRTWVEEARAQQASLREKKLERAPSAYQPLIAKLEALGPPNTHEDRAALWELISRAEALLTPRPDITKRCDPLCRKHRLQLWTCLLCGEATKIPMDASSGKDGAMVASPQVPAGRRATRKLSCERCGGSLVLSK